LIGPLPKEKKKVGNYGGSPKIEDYIERWDGLPLWPNYIAEKGRNFGQNILD
jgi:hypothetical protein